MFEIEKIVKYLGDYKNNLSELYKWNAKLEKLVDYDILTKDENEQLNSLIPFEKEIKLKEIVGNYLNKYKNTDKHLYERLCIWIIKDWGGIKAGEENKTIKIIENFLITDRPNFNRIASASKVGAYLNPQEYFIYDARVAYALNWIILITKSSNKFFPIPLGRNSKMNAFNINTLIRLNYISFLEPESIKLLNDKFFIKNIDKEIYINEKDAYFEMKNLIKSINHLLWQDDLEKVDKLYYTEMLLFSIADKEIIADIVKKYRLTIF